MEGNAPRPRRREEELGVWKPPLPELPGCPPKPTGRWPRVQAPLPGPGSPPWPRAHQLQEFEHALLQLEPSQEEVGGEALPGAPGRGRVFLRGSSVYGSVLHLPGPRNTATTDRPGSAEFTDSKTPQARPSLPGPPP